MADCKVCSGIVSYLTTTGDKEHINLGSFAEAQSSPCPSHTPLIKAFQDHCNRNGNPGRGSESKDVGFHGLRDGKRLTLYESIVHLGAVWDFMLVQQPSIPNHRGVGRILDPDWVDLDFINQAKEKCFREHGAKCQNPIKVPKAEPAWLVDVKNRCIVPGKNQPAYVALSYVRGQTEGLRLNAGNLDQLQKPGSIDEPEISSQLAPMVKHAIQLMPMIKEHFLWVDCLCIVHGGDITTADQLNIMSAIYASAVVTIVAADGESADGLLGIKDVSSSRHLEQRIFPVNDETLVLREMYIFSLTHGTEYHKRAWTYQELTMSPRKIFFNEKEVHWQCQCSVWHEETIFPIELDKYIDPRPGVMLAGFPDLGALSHALSNYNERKLTYDEDALCGVAGYLAVLSRCFAGGFLYGCPEMFLDRALSWQPLWNHISLKRRVVSDRPASERVGSTALPSWSWIGWSGMTSFGYGEAALVNFRVPSLAETVPITEWYTSSTPDGKQRRRVHSTWFEDREAYKESAQDLNKPLPDGWTRHTASDVSDDLNEPRLYPDGCGEYLFSHEAMPGDKLEYWYYPFPVSEITHTTPFFTPEQTAYLFCITKGTKVWAERADYEEFPGGQHSLKFRNEQGGQMIGRIRLHNDEQWEMWPRVATEDEVADGKLVEVVAVHETIWQEKTFNKELGRYERPLKREERVAVLWIEWNDGVAYRLASGWVAKTAWEGLDLKDVQLVLG